MEGREGAHMTWHEAANAATPDQKAVHSSVASLTCSVMLLRFSVCLLALKKLAVWVVAVALRSAISVMQHGQCTQCASMCFPQRIPKGFTRM